MSLRRTNLLVEELAQRTLPSVSIGLLPGFAGEVAHHGHAKPLHGEQVQGGTGSGTYVSTPPIPDAGLGYDLSGTVVTNRLGTFNVSGSLHGVGFLAQGNATGQLVLTNAQGTITLGLHGPTQPGFSPLPSNFAYTVTGGTGAYQHVGRSGTAHFTFTPAAASSGGSFTVTF